MLFFQKFLIEFLVFLLSGFFIYPLFNELIKAKPNSSVDNDNNIKLAYISRLILLMQWKHPTSGRNKNVKNVFLQFASCVVRNLWFIWQKRKLCNLRSPCPFISFKEILKVSLCLLLCRGHKTLLRMSNYFCLLS